MGGQRKLFYIFSYIINYFYSPIDKHSKKPQETRDRIIKLVGDLPRVELFAREAPAGWDVWGNEVESNVVL